MRKLVVALLLVMLVTVSAEAQTNKPWKQYGSLYTLTTGGQNTIDFQQGLRTFTDVDGNHFRCKMFWCYNNTNLTVHISRFQYIAALRTDEQVELSSDPGTRWLDAYNWAPSIKSRNGIAVLPGQMYVSYLGFDGFYFTKGLNMRCT